MNVAVGARQSEALLKQCLGSGDVSSTSGVPGEHVECHGAVSDLAELSPAQDAVLGPLHSALVVTL
jgi:hypothetical protein